MIKFNLRKVRNLCLLFLIYGSVVGAAEIPKELPSLKDSSYYSFNGIPALNYSSDDGFGFGVVGAMYKKDLNIKPYIFAVDMQIFFTTKKQNAHFIRADFIDAFNLPIRLRSQVGFQSNFNQNYCGNGILANCFQAIPAEVTNPESYFWYRYFEIYGIFETRYRLKNAPHKIELMGIWRGSYYIPGTWGEYEPYENSLYVKNFPDSNLYGGFASVLEAGVMFDNRDNEPSPTSGYWAETTLRGSSKYIGSKWNFWGFNLSFRGYLPFDEKHQWVLASQSVVDGSFGNAPLQEIVRVGGSLFETAYGGANFGRGLRTQYFPGRVKIIEQLELRYNFLNFNLLKQRFALTAAGFIDAGMTSWQFSDFTSRNLLPILGFGGGIRLAWNENFLVRFDLGVSAYERYSPRIYIKMGNVF